MLNIILKLSDTDAAAIDDLFAAGHLAPLGVASVTANLPFDGVSAEEADILKLWAMDRKSIPEIAATLAASHPAVCAACLRATTKITCRYLSPAEYSLQTSFIPTNLNDSTLDELLSNTASLFASVADRIGRRPWQIFCEIVLFEHPIATVAAEHAILYKSACAYYYRAVRLLQEETFSRYKTVWTNRLNARVDAATKAD